MAVALSPEAVAPHLMSAMDRAGGLITVGCVNAPTNVTITGDVTPLEALQQDLDGKGIFARRLQVSAAYHSHHMVELADSYRQSLQGMPTTAASAPMPRPVMFSSVAGERMGCKEAARPDYWVKNLLGKVEFATSLTRMVVYLIQEREVRDQTDHDMLIEVGPHPALQRPIRDTVQHISGAKHFDYNPILARGADLLLSLASSMGRHRYWGCSIDLATVSSPQTPIGELQGLPGLPAYEFNHSRSYWMESRISKGLRFREQGRHELLGVRESDWNPLQPKWRNIIRLSEHQWIPDHRFGEQRLYPAAGMIVMVIEACRQLVEPDSRPAGYQFHDVTFSASFAVPSTRIPWKHSCTSIRTNPPKARKLHDGTSKYSLGSKMLGPQFAGERSLWIGRRRGLAALRHDSSRWAWESLHTVKTANTGPRYPLTISMRTCLLVGKTLDPCSKRSGICELETTDRRPPW